jgi:hypothetical protein
MRRAIYLFVSVGLVGASLLYADSVTYTVTPDAGHFDYDFTVTNTGDTGGTLFDLFLSIATDISNIDTADIGTPIGWGDPTGGLVFYGPDTNPGTSFIEWSADGSGLYDVAIGQFLSEFTFQSSQQPTGPILFALNGSSTLSPAIPISGVPEPTTVSMMILGIVSVYIMRGTLLRAFGGAIRGRWRGPSTGWSSF